MKLDTLRDMLGQSVAIAQITKTVYRIKDDPEGAETAPASW